MNTIIVGCGRIARKSHTEALINNNDIIKCVYACDIIFNNACVFAEILQRHCLAKPKIITDYKKILENKDIESVIIATESGNHYKIAIDALNAGKHVLVEKPLALSTNHMNEMIKLAEENGLKLAVCHQNRFNPSVQELRNKLDSGAFGNILYGTVQIRWSRDEGYYTQAPWRGTWTMDGGSLMNQSIHGIDLLQWMLGGDVDEVYGIISNMKHPYIEAEDFGGAILRFKSGAIGIVEATTNVYPRNLEERLSIFGEKGTVEIGGLAVNRIQTWLFDGESRHSHMDLPNPETVYGHSHIDVYRDFYNAILNDREPYVNGKAGRKAVDIVLAIYKSYKENQPVKMYDLSWSTRKMIDSLKHRG